MFNPKSFSRLTCILDKGLPLSLVRSYLQLGAEFIDVVKIGWGTSLLLSDITERIALYKDFGIAVCNGGTLYEMYQKSDDFQSFKDLIFNYGFNLVEISDGTIEIPSALKCEHISYLSDFLPVFSEVGSKDSNTIVAPIKWVNQIIEEFASGSSGVILEGRESGSSGLYRTSGELRYGLIEEILSSDISSSQLIFEAPQKDLQVEIIKIIGPDVNLANISFEDILPLECLRRGYRSDTLELLDPESLA